MCWPLAGAWFPTLTSCRLSLALWSAGKVKVRVGHTSTGMGGAAHACQHLSCPGLSEVQNSLWKALPDLSQAGGCGHFPAAHCVYARVQPLGEKSLSPLSLLCSESTSLGPWDFIYTYGFSTTHLLPQE